MTNEQCTAVAEEVWGWKFVDKGHDYIHIENCDVAKLALKDWFNKEDFCKRQALSWQGFGRTVEAMFERGDKGFICDIISLNIGGYHTTEELIEATHLAALEAVREEEKK